MTVKSMQTNEDKTISLEIVVDAETFAGAVDAAFKKNGKRMQVPGFRRGKAPRKMIERLYGEGVFYEDAVNATYPKAYDAAVTEKEIDPVDRAKIEVQDVSRDGYTFTATVTVKPEVTLKEYKGIEAEKILQKVEENEIDHEISQRREQGARVIAVEGRSTENGDLVVIDYDGFLEDKPFEGGKGEKQNLELGSGSFIPGFEEQVIGHAVGDEFEVNVSFPENYHAEELKGKAVVFKCKLHDIKKKELPELDDEFAKDISEFDTLAELREDIRKKLQEAKDEKSQTDLENSLLEKVSDGMTAEIPQCMFDSRINEMVKDFEYRLQSQGLNLQHYLAYAGTDMETFRKSFVPQAEQQVKTRLALEAIVKLEKIEPTEAEITEEYEKIAKSYGMTPEKIKPMLPEEDIKLNIAMGKALDLVRQSAKVKETQTGEAKTVTQEKPKRTRAKKPKEEAAE